MLIRDKHRELACPGWREHTGTSVFVQVRSAAMSRALSAAANAHAKGSCLGQQGLLWLGRSYQADVPSGLVGGLTSVSAVWLIPRLILSCQRGQCWSRSHSWSTRISVQTQVTIGMLPALHFHTRKTELRGKAEIT